MAQRSYVKFSENKGLQEAIDLVTKQSLPVNTANRIKSVPRTTLRKALEKMWAKGNVVTKVTGKKWRYQVDSLRLTAESPSKPISKLANTKQEEVDPAVVAIENESENLIMELEPEVYPPVVMVENEPNDEVENEPDVTMELDTVKPTMVKSKF